LICLLFVDPFFSLRQSEHVDRVNFHQRVALCKIRLEIGGTTKLMGKYCREDIKTVFQAGP
jgi:hypothetical protein